jgi:putative transposase
MSSYRRANVAGGTYFFTVVTERRQPILLEPDVRAALRSAIEVVRVRRPFVIEGWVLLPDHLHAIWTLPPADADFATRWRLIKTHVTQACGATRYGRAELLTPSAATHLNLRHALALKSDCGVAALANRLWLWRRPAPCTLI